MTVAAPEIEEETTTTQGEPEAAAESQPKGLFKWSQYVHVGDGAEECDNGENGKCRNAEHFHGWVRLPNQFQMRDITEKAMAAKARRIRTLRDEESDARVIMEDELQVLLDTGMKDVVIDEIIDKDYQAIYVEAVREVDEIEGDIPELESEEDEEEDSEASRKFAGIDQDREEYARLKDLPLDERGEDFKALEERVAEHSRAIEEARERIIQGRRAPLEQRSMEDLVGIIRRDRIELAGAEAYLNAFNTWQWYVCTYKPVSHGRPGERYFSSYNAMRYEADEDVIEALVLVFEDLRSRLAHSRAVKKS